MIVKHLVLDDGHEIYRMSLDRSEAKALMAGEIVGCETLRFKDNDEGGVEAIAVPVQIQVVYEEAHQRSEQERIRERRAAHAE